MLSEFVGIFLHLARTIYNTGHEQKNLANESIWNSLGIALHGEYKTVYLVHDDCLYKLYLIQVVDNTGSTNCWYLHQTRIVSSEYLLLKTTFLTLASGLYAGNQWYYEVCNDVWRTGLIFSSSEISSDPGYITHYNSADWIAVELPAVSAYKPQS